MIGFDQVDRYFFTQYGKQYMQEPNGKSIGLTKEHFDDRMDTLTKEIQDMRDEFTLHQGQHEEIGERLETIEQKLDIKPL